VPVSTTFYAEQVETCQKADTTQHWYQNVTSSVITKMDFTCIEAAKSLVASAISLMSILYITMA